MLRSRLLEDFDRVIDGCCSKWTSLTGCSRTEGECVAPSTGPDLTFARASRSATVGTLAETMGGFRSGSAMLGGNGGGAGAVCPGRRSLVAEGELRGG
jgi:hypothetical protein